MTVRNTVAPGEPDGSEVKLFSAMLHREAVVIAQLRVPEGTFDHEGTRLSKEVVHGITSLTADQASPEVIARFVRQHWGIERTKSTGSATLSTAKTTNTPTPAQAPRSSPPYATSPSGYYA